MINLFLEQVKKYADKTALSESSSGKSVTYQQLDENARKVAAKLIADGFGKGSVAVITASRGIGFVQAILGILMAGGAYVPLSDHYPADRIEYIMHDCGAAIIVDDAYICACAETAPIDKPVEVSPDDTALIIYTSGSTGVPKGIAHDHKAIISSVCRYIKAVGLCERDICAVVAPFYFVAHITDLLSYICCGAELHIVPDELRGAPVGIADFIEANRITTAFIPPKVLRFFTKKGDSLKTVVTGSERLSQIAPNDFRLFNLYGMTETASMSIFFEVDKQYDNTPIGKPADGVNVYLLDNNGKICEEGEICVSGNLGRGYLNLPEKTAEVFTPNPFKDRDGHDILIHTGDLGKRLPDGNIVYLNRNDWMIKINGQRVEPGEIEAALRRLDGVKDAVVKDFIDTSGQTFITAYYITDTALSEEELKAALSAKLPAYMVPSFFTRLEKLPVNANGKLDRNALPKPDIEHRRTDYAAPENERQKLICEAFGEVLGIDKVGINDDFFSLGGDSIKVLMLQKALRSRGIEVSAHTIYNAQNPGLLSEAVSEVSSLASFSGKPAQSYPLTRAQMSIYLDCQLPGKETVYNNVFTLFLPSDMNADEVNLKNAVDKVLNSYPILSSVTKAVDGMPSLVPSGKTIETEIRDTDHTDRKALSQTINTPFDLENDLPCRAVIFRTPEGLVLVLVLHHIVCDGTTASIILGNIASVYDGAVPAAEEMSNLTLAQYEAAHPEITQADNDIYRKMLDEVEGDTELYSDDAPALSVFKDKLAIYETTLYSQQHELSGKLIAALSEKQLTESTLFMSAYAYLLHLFCNQKHVLFFTGENGRHDPILQNTVGMLVHNLPVLVHIDENTDCSAFMADVQNTLRDLIAHDSADIAELCGEYGIHPDCFFVYQGEMLSGVTIGGRYIPMEIYQSDDVMASLTLHVLKQNSGDYKFTFEYAAEKLADETVRRMAEVYAQIVAGLCSDGKLGQIRLVNDDNITEMDAFNATEADYPVTDIVSLFRAQVEKTPDRPAVIFKNNILTYAQIDDISERIAGKIRSLGIGKGDAVSILIPRCSYMTTASLGVLKSGAAYQPLDPSYPSERLSFMMSDADAKLLIADEDLLSKVPDYKGEVLLTKDIPTLPACEKIKDVPDPSDVFILLYTSGSTGIPKGVMLEHRNLANFCAWYREFYHLDETSRVAAYASYGFDANMMDQYPALTTGACIYIIEEEIRLDLLALETFFNENEITHGFMTTQVGRQFYSMTSTEKLRYLSTGGEKLVPLPPKDGDPALFNAYGPTECTIYTTAKRVDRLYERVPIGRPLNNYKCYVIDENGRRLPPLIPGELLISGRGVGRGYLNRPELTEKVFIRNPFDSGADYARAYRSGDVVRLLPNGEIDFIGRNDGQVKVRGFRIELTEVEGVIRSFKGIKDATVQAFEDESSGEKYIAAYVVADDIVDISALNAFILDQKPPYMVPAVTMQIDSIPLNQNQKVNKKALPKPQRQNVEVIPPQNDVQQKIFDCIAEVVGHTEFGITTNIYEAGLSSIGAIKLNVLLSKAFDAAVTSRDLKENNTIDKLETFLIGASAGAEVFEVQPDYGLSKTQEGVYVESIARTEDTIYNIPILLEISDEIDTEKLKSAVVAAVNAHPILKTRLFINDDGDVRMRRMDGDFSFDESCVKERDIVSLDDEKKNLVKPFKLLGGRLFRVEILHGEKTWLFIEMHHIISDGSSTAIFLNDISAAYEGKELETESYSGYEVVLNEEKLRAGEAYKKAKNYYEKLLDGAETQSLPAGDMINAEQPVTRVYEMLADGLEADELKAWCEKSKASMNGLFSAAFGLTLNKYLGTESVVFAGIYSGRNDSRLASTIAMLVKTLPIAVSIHSGKTTAQLAHEVSEQLVDSQSNDIYSFAEISRALNVNADVMFAWQGDEFIFDKLCGKPAKLVPLELSEAKAPMNLNVFIDGGKIRFSMEYRGDKYSEKYIRDFLCAFEKALAGMVRCEWLSKVSVLSDNAKAELDHFNDTTIDEVFPTAPALFAQAAQTFPDKTAVIACSGQKALTYRELWSKAKCLADTLIAKGVCANDRVALYMERDENVYAVREGIMLSGGAFVSLEPDYPDDRILYILKDAKISRLITTKELFAARGALFDGLDILYTDDIFANVKSADSFEMPTVIDEDAAAYCIYTSGSTGNPKGVEILHRNLANLLAYNDKNTLAKAYVDHSTVFLALAAITFDVSVIEEMMPLYHGKAVSIATEEEIHNPLLLMRTVKKTGVDMMKCTPSYLQSILDVPEAADALKGLNALIVGAEPFPATLYAQIRKAGFSGTLFNSYGPTETCVSVSIGVLDGGQVTIGGPTLNTYFLIRDSFGNLLPPYARGELVIAGAQVGKGYVNLDEMTKEKFITEKRNGRKVPAYRSGDIAYFNSRGEIVHCGRNDNQVKIRGLRIELDGVENVMNSFPGIKRSIVLVKGSGDGSFLCGYYASEQPVDEAALIAHMKETLTAYMIPGVFVHLNELPLTVNGKVNKKALPEPKFTQKKRSEKAPSTELQKQIAAMFAKALGLESVAADEDFFEIGGTSMLASKVAMQAMVQKIPIAYQDIFAFPTVEALERNILSMNGASSEEKSAVMNDSDAGNDNEIEEIKSALTYNTMAYVREITSKPLGDVLLTGATGFLGIHMLRELIENGNGKITCLIRKGSSVTAQKRLESMLVYYFGTNFSEAFESGRLKAVDGDITDRELVLSQDGISFNTVINCAACVKHFAKDDILERVNVKGVENLIALCEKTGSRLIQISTVSVAGENVDHALPDTKHMYENMLYFGQDLSNQYVRSKFDAEKIILSHIAAGKLHAKIIRVGNLMSRDSDGEFQVNSITSGFMRNLKGYAAIGAYPVSEMGRPVEFSPIDLVAKAVRLLSGTPDKFTVFHAVNGHWIEMGDVIAAMNSAGVPVDAVDETEFSKRMSEAMQDEKKNMLVSGLISYLSSDADTVRSFVPEDHTFTKNALYRLGYRWPLTDERYLTGAIEALISMAFFDGDEE